MEALELHHAETASLASLLAPYTAVGPGTGGDGGAEAPARELLPLARASPFHDEMPVEWVRGYDIGLGRDALVPRACVLLDTATAGPGLLRVPRLFQTGSSGLAAGTTMAEAVCHGICELVERDAQAMDAAGRSGRPGGLFTGPPVCLAAIRSPALADLVERLRAAGLLLFVHDLTTDLRIPAFAAVLGYGTERGRGVGLGFGAHLDPELAVLSAVLEAAQACTVVVAGSRDDLLTAQYRRVRWSDRPGWRARHEAQVRARPPVELPPSATTCSLDGDLREMLGRLRAAGYPSVVVVDLRNDDMGLDVVRVVVPGLEGYIDFDCYAPGPRARACAAGPGLTTRERPPRAPAPRAPATHWGGPMPHAPKHHAAGMPRAASLDATLARVWPAARAAGVTRVADITGLDRVGIPVALAIRPSSAWLAVDAGKGTSATAARASALMESLERHCAQVWQPRPFVASHARLERAGTVPAWELLPFARGSAAHPETEDGWVRGWDIAGGRALDLPYCMVGYDAGRSHGCDTVGFQPGSNGLAAGNCLTEAVCGALYELVERDAVACWEARTAGAAPGPRVALGATPFAVPAELVERFRQAGVEPLVFDCTSDLGVPVFAASLLDLRHRGAPLAGGYGCHLAPEVALTRALTEAAQSRAIDIAGSRDDMPSCVLRRQRAYLDATRAAALLDLPEIPGAGAHPHAAAPTFGGDIEILIGRLSGAGLDHAVAYDLTVPSLGIPVVRVVVPGLEGYPHSVAYRPGPRARAAAAGQITARAGIPA
jgi:ribosomal protein S12 methylthiotransferase accessory factor